MTTASEPTSRMTATVKRLTDLLRRSSLTERALLALMLLSASTMWGFGELAGMVNDGEVHAFDERLLLLFRNPADLSDPVGPGWFEEVMRDITALGGNAILSFITLGVTGYLLLVRKRGAALLLIIAVCSGFILSNLLKWGFDRPRPDLVPHISEVYTQSFPSGHAMLSAVVYLTIGAVLSRTRSEISVKVYLLVMATLATVLVGISRVYLGVHWPTDVLAGWAIGAGWASLWWMVMLWMQARGGIESESKTEACRSV